VLSHTLHDLKQTELQSENYFQIHQFLNFFQKYSTLWNFYIQAQMVPAERIELPTFGLQNRCSTAELCRRLKGLKSPKSGQGPENDPQGPRF
jgi:hypothetical protein